jgi:arylsulfatase A-like enzyme
MARTRFFAAFAAAMLRTLTTIIALGGGSGHSGTVDNLGYGDPGCYGGGVIRGAPIPRIDKLASEGTRLTNFNVEAQCTPSRSAILTGRFAIRSGTHSVPLPGTPDGLTQWEVTLAKLLSGVGYATGHFEKWHLGHSVHVSWPKPLSLPEI